MLRALGRLAHRRPGWMLAALALSLVPAGALAAGLTLRSSFLDLLPEDRAPVRQMREVVARSGAGSDVIVAIEAGNRARAERAALALADRLHGRPGVQSVSARTDIEFLRSHRLLYLEEGRIDSIRGELEAAIDREILRASGLYIDLEDDAGRPLSELLEGVDEDVPVDAWAVTTDGRWLCVWVFFDRPASDLNAARVAQASVLGAIDELRAAGSMPSDLEVRLAGSIPQRVEEDANMNRDLSVAGTVGFWAVVLLLVIAHRRPRALLLLSVPLLIGLVWTFGIARLAVGHLNIITGFLISVLSGLGIEYGIHLFHRYAELRREGKSVEEATELMVARTGRSLLAIGATNASVFAVTALAEFSGFREFGIIAASGMLLTLASTLLAFPALNVLLERARPMRIGPSDVGAESDSFPARSHGPINVPAPVRWAVMAAVLAFAGYSVHGLATSAIGFEGNWRVLSGEGSATAFGDRLRVGLGGTYRNATIWAQADADVPVIRQAIAEVAAARQRDRSPWDVASVHAIDQVVPDAAAQSRRAASASSLGRQLARIERHWLDQEQGRRLDEALGLAASAVPFSRAHAPSSLVSPFNTRNGRGSLVYVLSTRDLAETDRLTAWAGQMEDVSAELQRRGVHAPILSENWIAGEVFRTIRHDAPLLVAGTLLVVFLVLFLDLRDARRAAIVISPVLVGLLCLAGAMRLFGVDLNFMNAGILPVCVGISLDNGIHVYRRYLEEGPGSIPQVLRHTSVANLLSSLTNLMGFGALLLAHHAGLRSIAVLAILGVSCTYFTTSIAFPLALQTFAGRKHAAPREAPAR